MKRFLITLTAVLTAMVLCCSAGFASQPDEYEPGNIDMDALGAALGLTEEEMLKLTEGNLDVSDVDLSQIDLGAVVEAVGMTEEQAIEMIEDEIGIEGLDLSVLDLDEIDLGALVDAFGLTEGQIFGLMEGTLDPNSLNLREIDPAAVLDALGLTAVEAAELALAFAGMGDVDVGGTLSCIGRGALAGAGVGVAVVIVIIILLAVTGRKKRGKKQAEPVAVENTPEE